MKIKLTVFLLLSSFYLLNAQTDKGTFSVGLELEDISLSTNDFSIDGNIRGDYFIKDNWSVGVGFGMVQYPFIYSVDDFQTYRTFIATNKYFNKGGKWQPFIESNIGYSYSNIEYAEWVEADNRSSHELFLSLGGGVQYNANEELSLFVKALTEWDMSLETSPSNRFGYDRIRLHFGLRYNFNNKK